MFDIIGLAIIGAFAGYAAGFVMKGKGFGLLGNIAIGMLGAVLGGVVFSILGGLIAKLVTAFVGAVILMWLISFYRGRKKPGTRIT